MAVSSNASRALRLGSRVALSDSRFAFGAAYGAKFAVEPILERDSSASNGWRRVLDQSGGPDRCSVYRRIVPEPVLQEFGFDGISENDPSQSVAC